MALACPSTPPVLAYIRFPCLLGVRSRGDVLCRELGRVESHFGTRRSKMMDYSARDLIIFSSENAVVVLRVCDLRTEVRNAIQAAERAVASQRDTPGVISGHFSFTVGLLLLGWRAAIRSYSVSRGPVTRTGQRHQKKVHAVDDFSSFSHRIGHRIYGDVRARCNEN